MPMNPCFAHVCYPQDEAPYYFWQERFLADKCCKHEEHFVVYGEELIMGKAAISITRDLIKTLSDS